MPVSTLSYLVVTNVTTRLYKLPKLLGRSASYLLSKCFQVKLPSPGNGHSLRKYSRNASTLNFVIKSIGSTTFPIDLPILIPSKWTKPWPNTLRGGAMPAAKHMAGQRRSGTA